MKGIITIIAALLLSISSNNLFAQNIFPEKFEGCNTDQFALESDTTTAKINSIEFVEAIKMHIGAATIMKMRGKLQLQIIVDLDGNSCLISLENETNVKTKKLDLKSWIDNEIKWEIPAKKVGAIVVLEFTDLGIGYRRLGMDGNKGWHYLK